MTTPVLPERAQALVASLGLQPHPEGGWYAEVYRSACRVRRQEGGPGGLPGPRDALTAIYFLLAEGEISRWHVVQSDEVWCHLEGAPLALHLMPFAPHTDPASPRLEQHRLGPVAALQRPQHTVPAGVWQAARSEGPFSLVACFVAPGFEFSEFRLMKATDAEHAWLLHHAPALAAWI